MICLPCRAAADENDLFAHKLCQGKTHCDCQHKPVGTTTEKGIKANGRTEEN